MPTGITLSFETQIKIGFCRPNVKGYLSQPLLKFMGAYIPPSHHWLQVLLSS